MKSYPTYDDGTLVRLLTAGEEGAFTELYNRYWEQMVTVAFVKLHSTADAKEVVQEVFFDLWNRRASLDIAATFTAYLAGAVKFRVITFLSKEYRRAEIETKAPVAENDTSTLDYLTYNDLRTKIEATVSGLPEKCQLVYRLSREAGLSITEIAEEMNISPKTVETHLTKALKSVRGSLGSSMHLFLLFF